LADKGLITWTDMFSMKPGTNTLALQATLYSFFFIFIQNSNMTTMLISKPGVIIEYTREIISAHKSLENM
jgi:hypothetical protein